MDENQSVAVTEREEAVESVIAPPEESQQEKRPRHGKHAAKSVKKPLWLRILGWTGVGLGGLLSLIVLFFLTVFYTPFFPEWRSQYILMTYHTSNPWLCTTFFSQETIEAILAENGTKAPEGVTDPDLIVTPQPDEVKPNIVFSTSEKYPGEVIYDDGEVQIVQFSGKTKKGSYTARLIQIKDPSRVFLGVTNKLGKRGQILTDMCKTNDALCGINAGGFKDEGGVGSGGIPTELVVKDSVITVYDEDDQYEIIGFNQENVLVLGNYTYDELQQLQLRDAISWGALSWSPFLIMNGEKAVFKGSAGGYDPRSAIGQRADGLAMLLVVDGSALRSVDGANMELVADILWEYGAVNAANLDGGTSSSMALGGKLINTVCNPAIADRGRYLATAWLVSGAASFDDDAYTPSVKPGTSSSQVDAADTTTSSGITDTTTVPSSSTTTTTGTTVSSSTTDTTTSTTVSSSTVADTTHSSASSDASGTTTSADASETTTQQAD